MAFWLRSRARKSGTRVWKYGAFLTEFAKIRDSRTTAVEFPEDPISRNQGMFVDIFPLDDVPDGKEGDDKAFIIAKELWVILCDGEYVRKKLADGWSIHIKDATARKLFDAFQ